MVDASIRSKVDDTLVNVKAEIGSLDSKLPDKSLDSYTKELINYTINKLVNT